MIYYCKKDFQAIITATILSIFRRSIIKNTLQYFKAKVNLIDIFCEIKLDNAIVSAILH